MITARDGRSSSDIGRSIAVANTERRDLVSDNIDYRDPTQQHDARSADSSALTLTSRSIFAQLYTSRTTPRLEKRASTSTFTYCLHSGQAPSVVNTECGCITLAKMLWHGIVFGMQKAADSLGKCLEGCCNCKFCGARVRAADAGGGAVGGTGAAGYTELRRALHQGGDIRAQPDTLRTRLIPSHNPPPTNAGTSAFTYCLISSPPNLKRANEPPEGQVVPDINENAACYCIPQAQLVYHGLIFGIQRFRRWVGGCWGGKGCCSGGGDGHGRVVVVPRRRRRKRETTQMSGMGERKFELEKEIDGFSRVLKEEN